MIKAKDDWNIEQAYRKQKQMLNKWNCSIYSIMLATVAVQLVKSADACDTFSFRIVPTDEERRKKKLKL